MINVERPSLNLVLGSESSAANVMVWPGLIVLNSPI